MASEGKSTREILAFYFPGTSVRIAPGDDGWQPTQAGPLSLRATHPYSAEQKVALERIWSEAQRRLPLQTGATRAIAPEIVFAPTTEVFRQLTAQPGWDLAGTQGSTIVLQPNAVLDAHSRDASGTLLHEMLHVLVEAEASDRAPLWLREGLVEVLAGGSTAAANVLPASAIDDALRNASSREAGERAHRAAAAHVQAFVNRYGLSAVRGWLKSGVPAGVE